MWVTLSHRRRKYTRMGRRLLEKELVYEGTERVAVSSSWHWPRPQGTYQQHSCKRVPGGAWNIKRDSDKAPKEGHRQGLWKIQCLDLQPPSDLLTPLLRESQAIQGPGEPNTAVPEGQRRWQSKDILEGQVEDIQLVSDKIPDKKGREGLFWLLAYSSRKDILQSKGRHMAGEGGWLDTLYMQPGSRE